MNMKNKPMVGYRLMTILALIVGIVGIVLQFLPDFRLLAFMLTTVVLGSLIGGSNNYEEQDRQQLGRSYRKAFEWLLLVVLAAYALIELSKWFVGIEGAAAFLNGHWPGLILSVMCIVMGMAGLPKARTAESA
jgi:uncharacterized membrane protein (DUF4010 family)